MGRGAPAKPVGALRRTAAVAIVVAAAAAVAVLYLGRSASLPPLAPTAPIVVRASFDPSAPGFGDRVLARVVVELDRRAVQASTLRISDGVAPLTQLGPAQTTRVVRGDLELMTVVVPESCLSDPCVAHAGVTALRFGRARATVSARDGGRKSASSAWPTLRVRGRVLASDLASSQPNFEADSSPLAPSYRVSPSTLATVLDVLAVLCAIAAVAFAAWQIRVSSARRPVVRRDGDALLRALALAREAEALPVPDRRRALGLLARLLGRDKLQTAASDLAWSERKPQPDEVEALVSEIEQSETEPRRPA
jgi:hypothetical protein